MDSTGGNEVEDARLARRSLLKKAAVAGAVAWTAPMVIESVTNPAGALTCAPGDYHVVYQTNLSQRAPTTGTGCTHSGTNVTAASIGMTAAFNTSSCSSPDDNPTGSIAHIASNNGNCFSVTIRVTGGCDCTITSVHAHVHNRGPNNCPLRGGNYCWPAGTTTTGGAPLTAAGLGTATVTVQPNFTSSICTTGIHWGSPNIANGYLVVNVTCTG